jgi:hypothetical protein
MRHDDTLPPSFNVDSGISLESPATREGEQENAVSRLSIFLYRIIEDEHLKNRSFLTQPDDLLVPPPLALDLFYLVTPITSSNEHDQLLLGRVMQIMYDHAIVRPGDIVAGLSQAIEELRIILNPMSLEDLSKLWSAFMQPYRLSIAYEVKVVFVDSQIETDAKRVRQKELVLDRNVRREEQ